MRDTTVAGWRSDWYVAGDSGAWRNLTRGLGSVPEQMPDGQGMKHSAEESHAIGQRAGKADTVDVVVTGPLRRVHVLLKVATQHPLPLQQRTFSYRSRTGDSLTARVLLPPGYVAGRAYPTIVGAYPTYDRAEGPSEGIEYAMYMSQYGYVVLNPMAVLSDTSGRAGTMMVDLAGAVLPAIDEAVRLGYVDSTRVGLVGHSAGGYTVYALLTQTNRFRAAVALAGPANLPAWYGVFLPPLAHTPDGPYWPELGTEAGQFGLGGPPWTNTPQYVKNSPFFSADRIETPLLIAQGDEDVVPIEQGEQMYTALWRQGKRVQLARYLGEGHVIGNYYNQVDLHARIVGWFQTFIGAASDTPASARAAKARSYSSP
jgi:dipeptidyl aminopeptidase/acylaminoacyl peptidase